MQPDYDPLTDPHSAVYQLTAFRKACLEFALAMAESLGVTRLYGWLSKRL